MHAGARIALVVMLALVAAVYAVAWPGPFQFDDYATVAVDPGAQSIPAWWAYAEHHVRPLTKLTFVFSHALGTWLDHVPLGHRIGNLLIHLIAVAMICALGYRIARTCLPELDAQAAAIAAFAAAALFGLHPLATEAVSYISGRSMALGTLFAVTSLWAYIRWRIEARRAWLALALVACAGAMLARETAIVTPLFWALWEIGRQKDSSASWSAPRLRELQRHAVVPLAIIGGFAAWMLLHERYAPLLDVSRQIAMNRYAEPSFTLAMQYFASGLALLRYPTIDPDITPALMSPGHRLMITLALAALVALAWRTRRSRPHLLQSAMWVGLWLAPVYALPIRHDALAERHFYPAIWGITFALSIEALLWSRRHCYARVAVSVAALLLAFGLTVVTLTRVSDYRSEVALWEAANRSAPNKVRVLNNLGFAYMEAGRWDEAHAVLTRAVQLDPRDINAQDNLLTAEEREFGPVRWKRRAE